MHVHGAAWCSNSTLRVRVLATTSPPAAGVTAERGSPRPTKGSLVSHTPARHRKPPRHSSARPVEARRRSKRSPVASALRNKPARVATAAVAGSALMISGWPAVSHWIAQASRSGGSGQAEALGLSAAGAHRRQAVQTAALAIARASQQVDFVSIGVARSPGRHRKPEQVSSGYQNPLRGVSGLVPERIDQGVDFFGSGPVYAIGDAVITNTANEGWPGGGWITYQLTDGPDAGLMVYVAEDVTPAVQVGQHVTSSTVIADMFNGGPGIETGWADPSATLAESSLPEAGGIGANGPFPTRVGESFDVLLQSLGVPAAPNSGQPGFGLLPPNYPA
jgi:hypothetical protein